MGNRIRRICSYPDYGGGDMVAYVCYHSSNCALKTSEVILCVFYLFKAVTYATCIENRYIRKERVVGAFVAPAWTH